MPLPKPSIVIFDMDGTTVRHVNPRLLHLLEIADDFAFKFHRFFGRLFRRGDKATVYKTIETYQKRKVPRLLVHRAMHKVRRKGVEQIVEPCPGIYAVLDLLKFYDIPMGLVSNGLGKGYGHDVLEKFDLVGYFKSQIFREDIRHSKPNPEAILMSLGKLDNAVGKDDVVWYIGDRTKDIRAARTAQNHVPCRMVPIAYGLNAALSLLEKSAGPDHVLMSWYELYEILCDLFVAGPAPRATSAAA